MPINETIEELVDRVISKFQIDDVKKQDIKPPFRYLTNKEEIQAQLKEQNITYMSVMRPSRSIKFIDEQLNVLGLGDITTIENVIKKHEMSRKFKD